MDDGPSCPAVRRSGAAAGTLSGINVNMPTAAIRVGLGSKGG